jgi:ribosomal-protein-alanine N-acetyltransferase
MHPAPSAKVQVRVHIRWMIRRDMPEVLAIEHAGFEFPWGEEEFLRVLRQRNCIGMVAEHGERVVGFMIYELHKSRLQILNFAVHPEFRRQGVGAQMVTKLVGKLSSHRRTRITLNIRETNVSAQLFYRSRGFRASDVLREHYEDTGEDAYMMHYLFEDSIGAAPRRPDEPDRQAPRILRDRAGGDDRSRTQPCGPGGRTSIEVRPPGPSSSEASGPPRRRDDQTSGRGRSADAP